MDYGNKPSAVITNESVDLTEEASAKTKPTAESSSSVKETKMGLEWVWKRRKLKQLKKQFQSEKQDKKLCMN